MAHLHAEQYAFPYVIHGFVIHTLSRVLLGTGFRHDARRHSPKWQIMQVDGKRAHLDLNQGPADLQSAALTTELRTRLLC